MVSSVGSGNRDGIRGGPEHYSGAVTIPHLPLGCILERLGQPRIRFDDDGPYPPAANLILPSGPGIADSQIRGDSRLVELERIDDETRGWPGIHQVSAPAPLLEYALGKPRLSGLFHCADRKNLRAEVAAYYLRIERASAGEPQSQLQQCNGNGVKPWPSRAIEPCDLLKPGEPAAVGRPGIRDVHCEQWPGGHPEQRDIAEGPEREEEAEHNQHEMRKWHAFFRDGQQPYAAEKNHEKGKRCQRLEIRRKKFRHLAGELTACRTNEHLAVQVDAKGIQQCGESSNCNRDQISTRRLQPSAPALSAHHGFEQIARDVCRNHYEAVEPAAVKIRPDGE